MPTVACVPNGGCSKHLNVDVFIGEGLARARPLRLSPLRCSDLLQSGINSSSVLTVAWVPKGGSSWVSNQVSMSSGDEAGLVKGSSGVLVQTA